MTNERALAILEDALGHCAETDVRGPDLEAALAQLEASARETWPFAQFRHALDNEMFSSADGAARHQVANAALNGIRRVCRR